MFNLQLPFLQALGYAIANSLWQIALLWLLVFLVTTLIKQSSHVKYVTALSAQVAGFVWFVTTFQFYYRHCIAASVEAQQLILQNAVVYHQNYLAGKDSLLSVLTKVEETLPYLSVAYLLLLILLAVKWVRSFLYTRQLAFTGLQPVDAKWQSFINEMADRLDVLQEVKIYMSSIAKSPLTIGYLKPIILLPCASLNHLTTEQLEAVLLHELAHIKRADYIINMLVSVTEIILFFNPFTRLLSKLIQKEREHCCDDWVLQYQYNAGMYAEALLRIAYLQKEDGFQMNAAPHKKGELFQRIKRIVQPGEKTFNYKHQVAALLLLTGLLFSIAWLQPNADNYAQKHNSNIKEVHKQIVVTPLTAQINNPFFSAASLLAPTLQEEVNKSIAELDKTITDSVTEGMKQAKIALQQAMPAVSKVSSGNWQQVVEQAQKEAKKSLENIDWNAIQKSIPPMRDSSFILQALNSMMWFKEDSINEANARLDEAKQQPAQLHQDQTATDHLDENFLQQITGGALDAVKNLNLNLITEPALKASELAVRKAFEQQKKVQQANRIKQQELIKKFRDSYKKSADVMMKAKANQLPLPPLPPASEELSTNEPGMVISDFSGNENRLSFSQPVYNITSANNHSKTIHIISRSDSGAINIVIEIKQ